MFRQFPQILKKFQADPDQGLKARIANLSDDEVRGILAADPSEYRAKALYFAKQESVRRGLSDANPEPPEVRNPFGPPLNPAPAENSNRLIKVILTGCLILGLAVIAANVTLPFDRRYCTGILPLLVATWWFGFFRRSKQTEIEVDKKARKVEAASSALYLHQVPESIVLYLRAFADDRIAETLFGSETEEEQLAAVFNEIAPFYKVGSTPNELPGAGGIPIVIKTNWEKNVERFMEKAVLVVFRIGTGKGLSDEVAIAFTNKSVDPKKIIFFVPSDLNTYDQFRSETSSVFTIKLPDIRAKRIRALIGNLVGYVFFDADWNARFVAFPRKPWWLDLPKEQPLVPLLIYYLEPFFRQNGIEVKIPSRPTFWKVLGTAEGLTILAILISLAVLALYAVFSK